MAQEDILFLTLGFRFGCIQPPGIHADFEQGLIHQVPVIFAGFRIGRVVHRHSVGVIRRLGELEFVHEPAAFFHVVINSGARFEEWPDRDH